MNPVGNRERFSKNLQGDLVVLSAYDSMQLSADMAAPFTQESNFLWLTGISEPGWKLILEANTGKSVLVAPYRSEVSSLFDGRTDEAAIRACSGIDTIIPADEFEVTLRHLAKRHTVVRMVHDTYPYEFVTNPAQKDLRTTLDRIFTTVELCNRELSELRAIKQPEEIRAIQHAIDLTIKGFDHVRSMLSGAKHEFELEAEFSYLFTRSGASHAYAPIIAAGPNACTLHYGANNSKLKSRELILMDVGAKVDGYAADITRTFCKGEPTKRQRNVYKAVEAAHYKIISLLQPMLAVESYQQSVDEIMREALREVGLPDTEESLRRYFPHAISHGLGVDVHDSLGRPKFLEEGMVLTVEPGIYIPEEGIGVRIEDDILITSSGHRNLSAALSTSL